MLGRMPNIGKLDLILVLHIMDFRCVVLIDIADWNCYRIIFDRPSAVLMVSHVPLVSLFNSI